MEELHFSSLFHFVRDDKSSGKPPLLTEIILLRIFREARGSARRSDAAVGVVSQSPPSVPDADAVESNPPINHLMNDFGE